MNHLGHVLWHRRTNRIVARLALSMAFLFLDGCATIGQLRFERPEFDLTAVRVDGLGLRGGSLTLVLDVTNPNTYDLRTGQVDLALDLADARFGEAFLGRATTFEAGGVTTIEIPLSFTWAGVGAGARSLLEQGSVRYSLETRLTVGTPLGDRSVEMTTRGTVPVRKLADWSTAKPGASREGASISSG